MTPGNWDGETRRIWIVAGEASGDARAAEVMHSLREIAPDIRFLGAGGPKMKPLAVEPFDNWIAEAGVLGLWDVLRNYGYFRAKFHGMLARIAELQPHAVLLVDYPGFNLRLAKALRRRGYRGKSFITSVLKSGPGTADASRRWPASSIS